MSQERHPGINMHKFTVGSGFVGFLFAGGCALIFVLGLPALWYFVFFSAGCGIILAAALRIIHDRRSDKTKPLSILSTLENQIGSACYTERSPHSPDGVGPSLSSASPLFVPLWRIRIRCVNYLRE